MASAKLNISTPILGLTTGKPGEFIDKRATPDCENVEFDKFTIAKRTGTSLMGLTLSERVLAIGELHRELSRYVFRIGLTKFEEYSTEVWTDRAHTGAVGVSVLRPGSQSTPAGHLPCDHLRHEGGVSS